MTIENSENEVIDAKAKEPDMAEKLSMLEKKVESTEVVAKMLADPEIRQLLEAKQRGEKVRLSFGEETPKINFNPMPQSVDYDSMSNKELVEHTINQIVSSFDSAFNSRLEPMSKTLKNLESYVGNNEAKTVAQQVEDVRKRYSEFDTYLPVMKKLNQSNPELSVEELYLIGKRRQVGSDVSRVSSERPSSTSTKVADIKKRETPLPAGKAGFDVLMAEALDKLELSL